MKIASASRLVCIGDSVTDCERARPIGEGLFGAIGKGWVAQVDALLMAAYPAHCIRVTNVGISGNTVQSLAERWQTDVLDLKPDWLSVMIGINDVWRQFDIPRQQAGVDLATYERTYTDLLARTRPTLKGLVLMTPYFIEANPADAMRVRMDEYGAVVRRLAQRFDAILVDTQAAFQAFLAHHHSAEIAWDRVHPNHIGHMILARSFLDAVGFSWSGSPAQTR